MSAPVRVAQVVGKMVSGGVESVVFQYYRHMDHDRLQFDFYYDADSTAEPPEDLLAMGARFYRVPPYQQLPRFMAALTRHFRENGYPLVHAHLNTLSVFPLGAARLAGVPARLCHSHSTAGRGEWKKNALKYALRPFARVFATDCCACSRRAGTWLFGGRAMERGEVTVFPNAVDLERFRFDPEKREEARRELALDGRLAVGHAGRFCFQKNHAFLLEVFAEIRRRRPDAVLLLAGGGELEEAVRDRAERLGLGGSVRFLGVRRDMDRLYGAMDLFLLPSRYEGLPVVGVEAQASGLPCLFSDAVTGEAALCDSVRFLPLSAGAAAWAEAALEMAPGGRREDAWKAVRDAGFDIRQAAGEMERFYWQRCARAWKS